MSNVTTAAPAADTGTIQGERYKLAAISVYQKGTLVQVFAKFARIHETYEDIPATPPKPAPSAVPGTAGAIFEQLEPLPRGFTMPSLSVDDITTAIVGKKDIAHYDRGPSLFDTDGVIKDLGPEKLAQVLVKMGEVRKKVLEEGHTTFVPVLRPQPPKNDPKP